MVNSPKGLWKGHDICCRCDNVRRIRYGYNYQGKFYCGICKKTLPGFKIQKALSYDLMSHEEEIKKALDKVYYTIPTVRLSGPDKGKLNNIIVNVPRALYGKKLKFVIVEDLMKDENPKL